MSELSKRVRADYERRRKAGFFQDLGFKPGQVSDGEALALEVEELEAKLAREKDSVEYWTRRALDDERRIRQLRGIPE